MLLACADCNFKPPGHQCLHCGEQYETVRLLIEHQKKRQHFGGHLVLHRFSRVRRAPRRYRDQGVEEEEDMASGALSLSNPNGHCTDDEMETVESNESEDQNVELAGELPDLPEPFSKRRRVDEVDDVLEHEEDARRKQPQWVKGLLEEGFKGVRFNDDFTRYWCDCGKTPREGWLTYSGRSNIVKHRMRRTCTYDSRQKSVFDRPPVTKMTQKHFRKLIVDTVLESSLPFSVVSTPSFVALTTFGLGRAHLKVPSRFTVSRDVFERFCNVEQELISALSNAASPVAITFDLWSDRSARGFLGVTGQFFTKSLSLCAPVLAIVHVPKAEEGHTARRIFECISSSLQKVMGPEWKSKVSCSVTDGASNVTAASRLIGNSRRCLQHSLQLLLKHFCTSQKEVSTAMACCNYFARLSKISQQFRDKVGLIACGVPTRWNSYLDSAFQVYQARSKIDSYVNSSTCAPSLASALRARVDLLSNGGYRVLHDLVVFLKPLMDLTIDEEGEKYITSSVIVPRLLVAKRKIGSFISSATRGDTADGAFIDSHTVGSWETIFYNLWDSYVDGFLHDELLLTATLLDPRNGFGCGLSFSLLKEAKEALTSRLESKLDALMIAEDSTSDDTPLPTNAGVSVADARSSSLGSHLLPQSAVASIMGIDISSENTSSQNMNTVQEELRILFKAVSDSKLVGNWSADPMDLYRRGKWNLQLSREVALDVLSVPAGQAASERVFSIASRVIKFDRCRMSAEQVCMTTFVKKNTKALGLDM